MKTLEIGDHRVEYDVKRSPTPKYVTLRFKPNLELEIRVPAGMDVDAVIRKKQAWIEKKYNTLRQSKRILNGGQMLYQGAYYPLNRVSAIAGMNRVKVQNGVILIPSESAEDARQELKEWVTRKTAQLVHRKARKYASQLGIKVGATVVRDTKRWGYCTREGQLVFNWQLAALPDDLASYVVLHEVLHLIDFNHNRGFRTKLAALCPDFRDRQDRLKTFLAGDLRTDISL